MDTNTIQRLCNHLASLDTSREQLISRTQVWQDELGRMPPNKTSLTTFALGIGNDIHPMCWDVSLTRTTFVRLWSCLYPDANSAHVAARDKVFGCMIYETFEVISILKYINRGLAMLCEAIGTTHYNETCSKVHNAIALIQQKTMPHVHDELIYALELFNKLPEIGRECGLDIALPYLSMTPERAIKFDMGRRIVDKINDRTNAATQLQTHMQTVHIEELTSSNHPHTQTPSDPLQDVHISSASLYTQIKPEPTQDLNTSSDPPQANASYGLQRTDLQQIAMLQMDPNQRTDLNQQANPSYGMQGLAQNMTYWPS